MKRAPAGIGSPSRQRWRAELIAVVRLATPVILVHLGTMLMGTVDIMMLGRLSEVALAAAGLGNAVMLGLVIFPMGLVMGLDPLASQAYGAGDAPRLARYFKQGLVLATVAFVPIAFVIWDARPLLEWLGQPPGVVDGGTEYLNAVIPGALAILLYTTIQRTLQAMSLVKPAVIAMVIANLVNVVANYVLIFGHWGFPALGVAGSAWATSISRWVMLLCLVAGAKKALAPYWSIRLDGLWYPRSYGTFLKIGVPIGFHVSIELWVFMTVTLLMGRLGALELAGHQVAINLAALSYMVALGFAEAAATRVGNAVGRRDLPGSRLSAKVCLGLGTSVMALFGLLFFALPRFLVRLYTPEAEVVALAAGLLPIAALFQVFDGIQAISGGILRGTADTRVPATVALVGYWLLGLPLGAYLAFGALGAPGLWWGLTVGLMSAAVLLCARVVHRFHGEIAAVE